MTKISFGKHKGKELAELPESYLNWLLEPKLMDGTYFMVPEKIKREAREILGSWEESRVLDEQKLEDDPFFYEIPF